ncbi:hypothetical protein CMQ_6751 [Grosmannia clavigera kw1407]|uniref:Uncharacterized protein n=1 Tax=Grosmannia clavigera (strain kw1407 / UAMH 11150) TaxID=655863 RepID=F0X6X6_GROCL|nr:uncharacterized protein CMQ_6751 [Grosmannia clavigera kw1407]EFX06430.1 hypothetical protein CMQ_6751 [Grosmannia clavigera kw1407]
MSEKTQPWKKAWPPTEYQAASASATAAAAATPIDFGVAEGDIVVVDGTAANVKPAAPLRLHRSEKTQPWKASWTGHAASAAACATSSVDYGVAQGDTVVVDGTAASVKPSAKVQA